MNTVTLSIASREEVTRRARAAFAGKSQGAHHTFATPDLLWQTLTRKTGQGSGTIREAARRVGRDVKAVHGDIQALIKAGVIQRDGANIIFPYDAVHVDFWLIKAT